MSDMIRKPKTTSDSPIAPDDHRQIRVSFVSGLSATVRGPGYINGAWVHVFAVEDPQRWSSYPTHTVEEVEWLT